MRLTQRADGKVCACSTGMRQRLGLAACLLADPQLLILDEPMNGLDPAGMREMRDMIRDLAGEGRTVMLSSHLLDEVERTCGAVAIVDHGQVIRRGPIDELTEGVGIAVEVQCSDPPAAARALGQPAIASRVAVSEDRLTVTLAAPNAFATAGTLTAEFGFIAAAALGSTAGTADLTDGMFQHLVITGRSRLALYLARIPAGLSILLSLAAAGFAVACLVTAFPGSRRRPAPSPRRRAPWPVPGCGSSST
jgi:hypothetical protein